MSAKTHPETSSSSQTSPWTPAILLGPLFPTTISLLTVVLGQFTLSADPVCGDPNFSGSSNTGCAFLTGAVACSYLEIILFSWVFMGTTVSITLPGGKSYKIMKPFSNLRTIAVMYGFIYVISLGVFGGGIMFLADVNMRAKSSGLLIGFSTFLQISYWIMSILGTTALILIKMKQRKGGSSSSYKPERSVRSKKEKKPEPGTEAWFREHFENTSDGMDMMESDNLGKFFKSVDMNVQESEIEDIVDILDVEGTGEIGFGGVWKWYQDDGKSRYGIVKEAGKGEDGEEGDDE